MSNASQLANIVARNLVNPDPLQSRLGISSGNPENTLSVGGTIFADDYLKSDGSPVGGAGGIGTALGTTSGLKDIFYTDKILGIGDTITVTVPSSGTAAYILQEEIAPTDDADIIIADGDDLIIDLLGLSSTSSGPLPGTGGRVRAGQYTGNSGVNAATFPAGIIVSSGSTFSEGTFNGSVTITGNLSVAGTITKEDVTNVDSIGVVTARSGVTFGEGGTLVVGNSTGIGIGTDNPDNTLDIRTTSTVPAQFVTNTASGNGATLRIRKNDTATLSADDQIGALQFSGSDATDVSIYEFASIETKVVTPTAGAEDGVLNIKTTTGGSSTTKISIDDTTCTFTAGLVEKCEIAGTTLGSQPNNPIADGNVILFTGNESGTLTINFTGVHAKLASGETCSFTAVLTPNNSGYINTVNVDGQNITPQWANGAPSSGGSSGRDIYTFQIIKTGTGTSDYLILAAVTNYS